MTQVEKRNKAQYIRLLELMAIIGEEWGEAQKEINDYNWKDKKRTIETLEKAHAEIMQMYSPMYELQGLLEYMIKLQKIGPETCKKQSASDNCDCADCNI